MGVEADSWSRVDQSTHAYLTRYISSAFELINCHYVGKKTTIQTVGFSIAFKGDLAGIHIQSYIKLNTLENNAARYTNEMCKADFFKESLLLDQNDTPSCLYQEHKRRFEPSSAVSKCLIYIGL